MPSKKKAKARSQVMGLRKRRGLHMMSGLKSRAAKATSRAPRQVSEAMSERADVVQAMGMQVKEIKTAPLLDLLSEFLAVERGGVRLYTVALSRSKRPDFKKILEIFLRQTQRHVELLEYAIRELEGDPEYISDGAVIQEQRTQSFIDLDVPARKQEIADVESVLLAETKDNNDWGFLKTALPYLKDERARDVLSEIVSQVEDEEDQHVLWAKESLNQLMMEELQGVPSVRTAGRKKAA